MPPRVARPLRHLPRALAGILLAVGSWACRTVPHAYTAPLTDGGVTSVTRLRDGQRLIRVEGPSGAFYIDEREISMGQVELVFPLHHTRAWLSGRPRGAPNDPATYVSPDDAEAYCLAVSARLPTEAEWEFAARGPNGHRFPWGDAWPPPQGTANLDDESTKGISGMYIAGYSDGFIGAAPVDRATADVSWCGVRDLGGNVSEAVLAAPDSGSPSGYAWRGGSFETAEMAHAVADTWGVISVSRIDYGSIYGFRCAADAAVVEAAGEKARRGGD